MLAIAAYSYGKRNQFRQDEIKLQKRVLKEYISIPLRINLKRVIPFSHLSFISSCVVLLHNKGWRGIWISELKWFYRIGFLLLLMIVLFVFIKLQPIWHPLIEMLVTILLPFIIAGFITYLLHPIVERIHEAGLHRGLAVFIIYFLFFGGIGLAVYKGLPEIIRQLKDLSESVPDYCKTVYGFH